MISLVLLLLLLSLLSFFSKNTKQDKKFLLECTVGCQQLLGEMKVNANLEKLTKFRFIKLVNGWSKG